MAIIERPLYLNRIMSRINRGMMLILIGQRRVGKSFMLRQVKERLKKDFPDSTVVYISKEFQEFKSIITADDLYDYAVSQFSDSENYLLIDEVQDIKDYESALRSLHAEERCQIIATGSNAYVFSSELSTRLSGRYLEIPINSLSYQEFLVFHNLVDSDASLNDYLKVGGMPGLCHFDIKDESQIRDYLQGVYTTIMLKDVISRAGIRNVTFIENLSRFIADNIGKLFSVRNISNTMASQGVKISEVTTSSYLKSLCDALIISSVNRYDVHGKKLLEQIAKYYFADHGLRNLLCGFNLRGSIEKIIENVVWNRLLEQNFRVGIGMLRNGEVDFVATRGSQTIYVQATYFLSSEETIKREFGNLAAIHDNNPKYVVSMDPVDGEIAEYPGIKHVRLRDFLFLEL